METLTFVMRGIFWILAEPGENMTDAPTMTGPGTPLTARSVTLSSNKAGEGQRLISEGNSEAGI